MPRAVLPLVVGAAALAAAPLANAAPAWLPPEPFESVQGVSTSFAPQLAQSSSGDALAVWQKNASPSGPAEIEIWRAQRPAGGSWSAPARLSTQTGVSTPAVARNPAGAGFYAWARAGAASSDLRVATVASDGTVSAPADAVTGQSDVQALRIAIAPNGDKVAVWNSDVGGAILVNASVYRAASGSWSAPVQLSAGAVLDALALVVAPNGTFVAAWGVPSGAPRAAVLPAGGAWQASVPLDPAAASGTPGLAVGADSTIVAAWGEGAAVRWAERTPSNGIWQTPGDIATTAAPRIIDDVRVGQSGDRWVARWREQDPAAVDDGVVRVASRPAAGTWSAATAVSSAAVRDGVGGAVVGLGDGRAVAIWVTENAVRSSAMAAGGTWTGATSISPSTGDIIDVTLSTDGTGNAVAGWDQADAGPATTRRVEVAAFDGAGPFGRDRFAPATGFVGVPYRVRSEVVDAWSALKGTLKWSFGGPGKAAPRRTKAFGVAVSRDAYLYSAAGTYTVKVSATDALDQGGETSSQVRIKKPRGQQCRGVKASKAPKRRSKFRVRVSDIRSNQRLGVEAIRKLNAVQKWLEDGVRARDICGGALPHWKLKVDLVAGTKLPTQGPKRAKPSPLRLIVKKKRPGRITTRPRQFAVNQRVTAAAIRRLNALTKRMNKRLTGGDIVDGTLGRNRLVQGTAILAARPTGNPPAKSTTGIVKPKSRKARFTATSGQVRTNYRIARQALLRANRLYDRARRGLTGAQFKNGSITAADFAPSALPPPES
jgi:hypothetical protein